MRNGTVSRDGISFSCERGDPPVWHHASLFEQDSCRLNMTFKPDIQYILLQKNLSVACSTITCVPHAMNMRDRVCSGPAMMYQVIGMHIMLGEEIFYL